MDFVHLRSISYKCIFKFIRSYIKDCTSRLEKTILDIIELIAEQGIMMYNPYIPPDPIFDNFESSGLMDTIANIIKDKAENNKEYSSETVQLIIIYI